MTDDYTTILENLRRTFRDEVVERVDDLMQLLAQEMKSAPAPTDIRCLRRRFHDLAGNSGMLGFTGFSTFVRTAEQMVGVADGKERSLSQEELKKIKAHLDELNVMARALRDTP